MAHRVAYPFLGPRTRQALSYHSVTMRRSAHREGPLPASNTWRLGALFHNQRQLGLFYSGLLMPPGGACVPAEPPEPGQAHQGDDRDRGRPREPENHDRQLEYCRADDADQYRGGRAG
jgi:hypothetical protein